MRASVVGFFLGVLLTLAGFFALQLMVIRETADSIDYSYANYVFSDTQFPRSYFGGAGKVITHFLFPVRVRITYYDSAYHEVTSADKPGRYGAVVRLGLNGGVVSYRFITLYRTPAPTYWGDGPGSVTGVVLPPGTGIDPQTVQNQQPEISQLIKNSFFGGSPQTAVLLAGLAEQSPQDPPAAGRDSVVVRDRAWWYGLRKQLGLEPHYPYLTDLPEGYDADPAKKWPLVLYLHSNASSVPGLEFLRENELPGDIHNGLRLPAVVISPHCTGGEDWYLPGVFNLLDDVTAKYRIDPDRVYIVGSSTGGDYVVGMASQHPERFAALVTVAGEDDFADVTRLKDVPYWAFEGADDQVMDPGNPVALIGAIRKAGGTMAHLTLFPGLGHGSWDKAFNDPALWQWVFAQKRGQPEVVTPGVPST